MPEFSSANGPSLYHGIEFIDEFLSVGDISPDEDILGVLVYRSFGNEEEAGYLPAEKPTPFFSEQVL